MYIEHDLLINEQSHDAKSVVLLLQVMGHNDHILHDEADLFGQEHYSRVVILLDEDQLQSK